MLAVNDVAYDLTEGGAVTLVGLLVVFSILILLVFICWAIGKIMSSRQEKKKAPTEKPKAETKPEAPTAGPAPMAAAAAPQEDEGIFAAISAAVACMMEGKPFSIKSIRRAGKAEHSRHNAWKAAGIADNTRSF